MEKFKSCYPDTFLSVQEFSSLSLSEAVEPECSSENGSSSSKDFMEEVNLASNNPKKRAGRKKFKETRHPVYRGVRQRNSGKWVCEMREPNKKSRIWLGTYPTVEMAARAHDVAAIAFRGRSACLNFADSAWRLPVPASGDSKDIQRAAAEAAEAFRPETVPRTPSATVALEETSAPTSGSQEDATSAADVESPENMFYMDEEALFGMHGLLANMAEGLMLPPPQYDNDMGMDAESCACVFVKDRKLA